MRIAVWANEDQWKELNVQVMTADLVRMELPFRALADADAYLFLLDEPVININTAGRPIIVNSVLTTLKEMNAPKNLLRINAWPGFLKRSKWEVAGLVGTAEEKAFDMLGRRIIPVQDEPGFISARIIAMIINEAFFALGDNITTREEIDLAMKLGTNYPYGPFEWSNLIGTANILKLLTQLSQHDSRYKPAELLKATVNS